MDISTNKMDLLYLTNPQHLQKLKKSSQLNQLSKEDLLFYKKRIAQLTDHFLQHKQINPSMDAAFKSYAQVCIQYFKFMDKAAILQESYASVSTQKKKETKPFNMQSTNKRIMRTKRETVPKITDLIQIKRISHTPSTNIIIPQRRSINLKDPILQEKDISQLIGK
tara:strand:+ start:2277 stop:2774 length:498 start_codon:yes stop_codon:yes gene_type:complete